MKKKKSAEEATYKIHPVAAMFPMMAEDELDELALDIKANGQQCPILRDDDEVVLDGRNRLEACRRAIIEPKFSTLANGQDPVAFIMSANIERRSLNKGQRAMITAMAYPEKHQGKKTSSKNDEVASGTYVRMARTVLAVLPELAEQVRIDAVSLNDAYQQALEHRKANEEREKTIEFLREVAPDLAARVDDSKAKNKLTLPEALTLWKERQEEAKQVEDNQRETILRVTESACHGIIGWANKDFAAKTLERLQDAAFKKQWNDRIRVNRADLSSIKRGAQLLTQTLEEINIWTKRAH